MLTNNGRLWVIDLLSQINSIGSVTWIDVGTNGSAEVGTTTALTSAYGETASESEPTDTSVMFNIAIAAGEGNGGGSVDYKEVGLLKGDNLTLLFRQAMTTITKDATVAYNVRVTVGVNSV